MKVYYLTGQYTDTFLGGLEIGGNVRRRYILKIISKTLTEISGSMVESVYVTIRRSLKGFTNDYLKEHEKILEMDFMRTTLLKRMVMKPMQMLGICPQVLSYVHLQCNPRRLFDVVHENDTILIEFRSYKMLGKEGLQTLKRKHVHIIYIGHNFEPDFFSSSLSKKLVSRLEKEAVAESSLIIAASGRDAVLYSEEYNIPKSSIVVVPNIYPVDELLINKNVERTLAVVLPDHWGASVAKRVAHLVSEASNLGMKIIVIGQQLAKMLRQKRLNVEAYDYIPSRRSFLNTLAKAHIGLNYSINLGGSNVKKYDYALAGLVVLSNIIGARGDYLPYEYVFVDVADFKAKLEALLEQPLEEMGLKNRISSLNFYKKCLYDLKDRLKRNIERC